MSKRKREDERPDETPVTMIDLQATICARNRPTFVMFANANSNRFQYGIIYSIFSCLVPRNGEFLAVPPPNFLIWGTAKIFFHPPKLWTRFTPLGEQHLGTFGKHMGTVPHLTQLSPGGLLNLNVAEHHLKITPKLHGQLKQPLMIVAMLSKSW